MLINNDFLIPFSIFGKIPKNQYKMKKLFAFAITSFLLVSCNNEPEIDYTLFSGTIENPKGDVVTIYQGREKVKEFKLSPEGTFSDTLRIENGYYSVGHGRERSTIYLQKGDDINMTLNPNEFDETISYTGVGSENNNYLAAKYLADEKASGEISAIYSLEEKEFVLKMNEIKGIKEKLLNESEQISAEFKALEQKNLEFELLTAVQRYENYHKYFAKKEEFKASEEFLKPLREVNYSDGELYETLDTYKQLVQGHYSEAIRNSDDPFKIFEELKSNGSAELRTDLANMLTYEVSPNNENNEAYYKGILAISDDEEFKTRLTSKYEKVKLLAKGMPSPEFIDYENHKGGTMSLSDLKGKYVYVDVWATWCAPCKREIPYLKEVEASYHDKNIAFVSTSIDKAKDHNVWVEMVKDKELGGIQLFADNDWNSKFVKDYAIEGIPRFILIDPEGNIVTADAPRPSDPNLVKMFEELKL